MLNSNSNSNLTPLFFGFQFYCEIDGSLVCGDFISEIKISAENESKKIWDWEG